MAGSPLSVRIAQINQAPKRRERWRPRLACPSERSRQCFVGGIAVCSPPRDDGVPLAYHVRSGHPADWFRFAQQLKWERIPRTTALGRPVFIHAFEPDREDQSRAMTPFAALMTRLRMITKMGDL